MKDRDEIKELFSEKLGNYEAKVKPEMWAKISSQIAAPVSAVVSSGISIFSKVMIGVGISTAVILTAVIINSNTTSPDDNDKKELTFNEGPAEKLPIAEKELDNKEIKEVQTVKEVAFVNAPAQEKNDLIEEAKETMDPSRPNLELNEKKAFPTEPVANGNDSKKEVKRTPDPKATESLKEESSEPVINEVIEDYMEVNQNYIVFLPNVFSPNNDGINDFLSIESEGLLDFNIVVLDENYKTVYQSSQADFKWYGNDLSGLPLPGDKRYVYYITAKDINGKVINKYSPLTITR